MQLKLGPQAVLTGADIPARNCNDWSASLPQTPIAVVRPLDAAGVSRDDRDMPQGAAAVRAARRIDRPVRRCRAEPGWVAISLERMVGIEEIDRASATMTVKAGTPLETIQKAADEAGFFFPLDLGSRGSCAIGGNLSTNAGGNRVIRYGMTRELVLGLEVVLPDGTIVTNLNKLLKNNAGYDLKHLFIGSEGTLGIITRVVLRLFPKPRSTMAALCALADYPAVLALLDAARSGLGPLLSAFEVMWPDYWEVITARAGVRSPVGTGHGLYVLVEAQGTDESIDAPRFEAWLEEPDGARTAADAAVSQSVAQTKAFWAVRDICSEFGQVLGPHISYDIGLAVARMDEFAGRCKAALAAGIAGCESVYYGHIGDGNLHLVSWVTGLPVERQPKEEMDAIIYGLVRDMGGSVSAEHGIGTMKKKWLGHARSEAGDRADAHAEGRTRSRSSAQSRQGDLIEPEARGTMKSLKLDAPKSLSQRVMLRLRQAIIDGEFGLGAVISEEMIAQSFGVSRTPVREAMGLLQSQGLVVIRPQVGSFVFTPSAADISALCAFRIIIEPKAAELAYRHDRAGAVAAMRSAIAEMEQALAAKDNVAYGRADTALHEAFFAHCGNRYLVESYQLVSGRVAALRTNLSAPVDVQTPASFDEHRKLLRSVRARRVRGFRDADDVAHRQFRADLRAGAGSCLSAPAVRFSSDRRTLGGPWPCGLERGGHLQHPEIVDSAGRRSAAHRQA